MTNLIALSRGLVLSVVVAFVIVLFFAAVIAHAATLNRQLQVGMSGSDVSALQTFLAADVTLYPQGLVTGYFGNLTKAAVINFQLRNGISPVGRVGPVTLPVLNAQMAGGSTGSVQSANSGAAPIITNVGLNVATTTASVSWSTNEFAVGTVYFSAGPLTTTDNNGSLAVSGSTAMTDRTLRMSQSILLQGLLTNTTYYYLIHTTDADGNISVTWPSTFRTK